MGSTCCSQRANNREEDLMARDTEIDDLEKAGLMVDKELLHDHNLHGDDVEELTPE